MVPGVHCQMLQKQKNYQVTFRMINWKNVAVETENMVEGKLKIWIKGGKFKFRNDLYVKVLCDKRQVWKTDESDSSTPSWIGKSSYLLILFLLLQEALMGFLLFP